MATITTLKRVFTFDNNGITLKLDDPNPVLAPRQVLDHFTGIYPVLATATISGPEIVEDKLQFHFESVLGTKG